MCLSFSLVYIDSQATVSVRTSSFISSVFQSLNLLLSLFVDNSSTSFTGVSGVDYWYFVSAYCTLYGVKELTDDVILSAQSAFRFALTDGMNERDSERVQVLAERPDEVVKFLSLGSDLPHAARVSEDPERDGTSGRNSTSDSGEASLDASINDSSNRRDDDGHSVGVDIHSWSPSLLIARNVRRHFSFHNSVILASS